MNLFSGCRFIQKFIPVLCLSVFISGALNSSLWALENDTLTVLNPFLIVEIPKKETNNEFRLIDAQLLDEQMLENLSPALVAPEPEIISMQRKRQMIEQDHNSAICFKRCHSRNDFSGGAYTVKQWRLLIEKDGHDIFCKIPWGNSYEKEKVFQSLLKTADNYSITCEGIGIWE